MSTPPTHQSRQPPRRPPPDSRSSAYTADLRHEFEAETSQLLRGKFLLFNALLGLIWVLFLMLSLYSLGLQLLMKTGGIDGFTLASAWRALFNMPRGVVPRPFFDLVAIIAYSASFVAVRRGTVTDQDLLKLTFWLVFLDGALRIVMGWLGVGHGVGLGGVILCHVIAAFTLPWSARDAIRPIALILGLYAIVRLTRTDIDWSDKLWGIIWSLFLAAPGTFIAWLRHSRRLDTYRNRFFQRRYGELRRELVDARRIHEALFPSPVTQGPVRFAYEYEPMRQIGGDYLYATSARQGDQADRFSVVMLDVTGHGIPAALTVNRLHGELERVFAENPDAAPGDVLKLLNRYIHLTLANHSVYVTALCLRVDCTRDHLEYASGGHPPAFLRAVDGTVHELPSTSFVLGACADADFDPDPKSMRFGRGDAIIGYTDGAIEARDRAGRMLGVKGFAKLVAFTTPDPQLGWTGTLLKAVEQHRYGPPADDTLVIEIARPVTA